MPLFALEAEPASASVEADFVVVELLLEVLDDAGVAVLLLDAGLPVAFEAGLEDFAAAVPAGDALVEDVTGVVVGSVPGVPVAVAFAAGVAVAVAVADADALGEAVTLGDAVAVAVAVGDAVALGLAVAVALGVAIAEAVAVGAAVGAVCPLMPV